MAAVFTTLCALAQLYFFAPLDGQTPKAVIFGIVAATIILPAAVTYVAANKLATAIRALRRSTEAIIAGDNNSPVDVDCACEVGGLADSFRAMIGRLNNNILRMNVLAYSDPVTGLANRAVVSHLLGLIAKMRGTANCRGAMLFIDLDGFKRVNDTLGHEAGDELLRQVSERIITDALGLTRDDIDNCTTTFGELCQTCPEKIVFARFAGDEFVMLLPGDQDSRLFEHADNILKSVSAPFSIYGNEIRISASIGIARVPLDTEDPEQLLSYADIAMYAAKEAGRNQYRFFDTSLKEVAIERSQIEADLRKAIEQDALMLNYQPKVDAETLELTGVEALVRWKHPQRGMIAPSRFIAIAEQSGLMPALGSSILRMAARQARQWVDEGTPTRIAVNVSAVQFERPVFVTEVLAILQEHQVDPKLLEIEVTESMVMSDFIAAKQRMDQLVSAGVRISIDDFGTGYSNLSQLSHLPFSILKIDKSLIDGLESSSKSQSIVTAIVYMAHALGHEIVAEGIESVSQYEFLKTLDCDKMQGYLFGHPMLAEQLRDWRHSHAAHAVKLMRQDLSEILSAA